MVLILLYMIYSIFDFIFFGFCHIFHFSICCGPHILTRLSPLNRRCVKFKHRSSFHEKMQKKHAKNAKKKHESNFIVKTTFQARPVTLSTPAHSSRRELCAEGYNVAVRGLKRLQNFILLFIFCIF